MQHFVDYGIILALNPAANLSNIRLQLNRLPYPPYVQDTWKRDFPGSTAKLIQVTYLFFIISITKDVTYDKESRMRVCDMYSRDVGVRVRIRVRVSLELELYIWLGL